MKNCYAHTPISELFTAFSSNQKQVHEHTQKGLGGGAITLFPTTRYYINE